MPAIKRHPVEVPPYFQTDYGACYYRLGRLVSEMNIRKDGTKLTPGALSDGLSFRELVDEVLAYGVDEGTLYDMVEKAERMTFRDGNQTMTGRVVTGWLFPDAARLLINFNKMGEVEKASPSRLFLQATGRYG
jgi:hypothetical protein